MEGPVAGKIASIFLISFLLLLINSTAISGQTVYFSRANGNWDSPASWSTQACNGAAATTYPQSANDNVTICHQININSSTNIGNLIIQPGAKLSLTGLSPKVIVINGNLTLLPTSMLQDMGTAALANTLEVYGDVINDGSLNLYTSNITYTNLKFAGNVNSILSGSGSWLLHNLEISKAVSLVAVQFNSSLIYTDIRGNIVLTQGIYHQNCNTTVTLGAAGDFTINSYSGIRLSQGTLLLAPAGNAVFLEGQLEVFGGTLYVGRSGAVGACGLRYHMGLSGISPSIKISGGDIQVYQGLTNVSSTDGLVFEITNGTITFNVGSNVSTSETFLINDVSASKFLTSGGKIIFRNTNTAGLSDFEVCEVAGTVVCTKGSLQFGDAISVAQNFHFTAQQSIILPHVVVDGRESEAITLSPSNGESMHMLSLKIGKGKFFDVSHTGSATDNRLLRLVAADVLQNAFADLNTDAVQHFICRNSRVNIINNGNIIVNPQAPAYHFFNLGIGYAGKTTMVVNDCKVESSITFTGGEVNSILKNNLLVYGSTPISILAGSIISVGAIKMVGSFSQILPGYAYNCDLVIGATGSVNQTGNITCEGLHIDGAGSLNAVSTLISNNHQLTINKDLNVGIADGTGNKSLSLGTSEVLVKGNLFLHEDGVINASSSTISIDGNWVNRSIRNPQFSEGVGKVVFSGSTAQSITNTAGTEQFYNFEVNKTSLNVTLTTRIIITNELKLTRGKMIATLANKLFIRNGGVAIGASDLSFIEGPITKIGIGNFEFPIGKGSVFRPITISPNGVASDEFTAEYFNVDPDGIYPTANKGAGVAQVGRCEYWNLTRDVGTAPTPATVSYGVGSCGRDGYAAFRVLAYNGSLWTNQGRGASTGNAISGTLESAGALTNYGPIAIMACNEPNIIVSGNTTICSGQQVTLSSSIGADTYLWSNGATSESITVSASGTYSLQTNSVGCSKTTLPVSITSSLTPSAPTVVNGKSCGSGSVNLAASGSTNFKWYTVSTGGTGVISVSPYQTPFITSTTNFYVAALSAEGCESTTRTLATAIINPIPNNPFTTSVSRCGPGSVDLQATGAMFYRWYSASTGGTLLDTNALFTTPTVMSTTQYYVAAITPQGCESNSRAVGSANVNSSPGKPIATGGSRCGTGRVLISASGASSYQWFNAASGGAALAVTAAYMPTVTVTTPFYVTAVSSTGCVGTERTEVIATVNPLPGLPTSNNSAACGPASLKLTATGNVGFKWYSAPTGGTLLSSDPNFNTPVLSSTTSYFVAARDALGCESANRFQVNAIINTIPQVPTTKDTSRCGEGEIKLSATGSDRFKWYDSTNALLYQGIGIFTTTISKQTAYFVKSLTLEGCESSQSTKIVASVLVKPEKPLGTSAARCGPGSVTLQALKGNSYKWYTDSVRTNLLSSDSSYTTPTLTKTQLYFVANVITNKCESNLLKLSAIVHPLPPSPQAISGGRCSPGSISLSTTLNRQALWYDTVGTLLYTGSIFNTPLLYETTKYLVAIKDSNLCESQPKGMVIASINLKPALPTANDMVRCGEGKIELKAFGAAGYHWYKSQSDTVAIDSSNAFVTPVINATTSYFISAKSADGCISDRKKVNAIINPLPSPPTNKSTTICAASNVTLTVDSVNSYRWYNTSLRLLHEGIAYDTTLPTGTINLKIKALSKENCESSLGSDFSVTLLPVPGSPTLGDISRCGKGNVTFQPSGSNLFTYYSSTLKVITNDSISFTTATLDTTTIFHIASRNANNCESDKVKITAVIKPVPEAPMILPSARCGNGSVVLYASQSVKWYQEPLAVQPVFVGDTFTTPLLTTTKSYYAGTLANGCESNRTEVVATINKLPLLSGLENDTSCGPGPIQFITKSTLQHRWYSDSLAKNLLFEGTTFTLPYLEQNTNYYVKMISAEGCESNTAKVQAIINLKAPEPVVTNNFRCGAGSLSLTSRGIEQIEWFESPDSTRLIYRGNVFSTPVLQTNTTYFVQASSSGCKSLKKAVMAQVSLPGEEPIVKGDTLCRPGEMYLSASGGNRFHWYDSISRGVLLADTNQFRTPHITKTTSYFVSSVNKEGCESPRVLVKAVLTNQPLPPIAERKSRCGGGVLELLATGSTGKYLWYSELAARESILSNPAYTTPRLDSSKSYYVASIDDKGCESSRTMVTATIDLPSLGGSTGPSATVCKVANGGTITLSDFRGDVLKWESSKDNFATISPIAITESKYKYRAIDTTTSYRVVVQNGSCPIEYSTSVTITTIIDVNPGVLAIDNIAEKNFNYGELQLLGYIGTIDYWQVSSNKFITSTNLPNHEATLQYKNLDKTTYYRVFLHGEVCPPQYSSMVEIIIKSKPILKPDSFIVDNFGSFVSNISVLENDRSPDGDQLLIDAKIKEITSSGGIVTIDEFGQVSYTPSQTFVGTDSVFYNVCVAGTKSIICNKGKIYFIVRGDPYKIYPTLSPNNDGKNETWEITNIEKFPGNTVKIFDRWGSLVFEQQPYNNTTNVWNGNANRGMSLNKNELPDGTYFYMLDLGNNSKVATGFVVLKR